MISQWALETVGWSIGKSLLCPRPRRLLPGLSSIDSACPSPDLTINLGILAFHSAIRRQPGPKCCKKRHSRTLQVGQLWSAGTLPTLPAPYTDFQSQRDCVFQPRVARNELPWVSPPSIHNPNG